MAAREDIKIAMQGVLRIVDEDVPSQADTNERTDDSEKLSELENVLMHQEPSQPTSANSAATLSEASLRFTLSVQAMCRHLLRARQHLIAHPDSVASKGVQQDIENALRQAATVSQVKQPPRSLLHAPGIEPAMERLYRTYAAVGATRSEAQIRQEAERIMDECHAAMDLDDDSTDEMSEGGMPLQTSARDQDGPVGPWQDLVWRRLPSHYSADEEWQELGRDLQSADEYLQLASFWSRQMEAARQRGEMDQLVSGLGDLVMG